MIPGFVFSGRGFDLIGNVVSVFRKALLESKSYLNALLSSRSVGLPWCMIPDKSAEKED